jgi:hypothetical protein
MAQQQAASSGIGLGGAVFLVFLVLKLTGHIGWSWWWVTAPLWGVFALVLAVFVIAFAFAALGWLVRALFGARRRR